MSSKEPQMFKPNVNLKQKIAPNGSAKNLFPKEVVDSCQELLNEFKDSFFEDASTEFSRVNDQLSDKTSGKENSPEIVNQIAVLKGRAEAMGLSFISKLMFSLQDYIEEHSPTRFAENVVIEKHIEALKVALQNQISDDGGALGKELLQSIDKLKEKMK